MSLASMSMLFPSVGIWEYFKFTEGIVFNVATWFEGIVTSLQNFQSHNPDAAAVLISPHFYAASLALVSCLIVAPIPEAATIEVLFGYGILNFVYLGTFLMTQVDVEIIISYWLLPNFTYIATCAIITLISRLFLSPMSRFLGPKSAAVSNYWMATELGNGTFSKSVRELHRQYGDVVRTGPNELSVNDAEAIVKIYGGKYQRGSFYEAGKLRGQPSIKDTRSQYHHTIWRRIWDKAFTPGELKHHAAQTESVTSKLVNSLKKQNGEEVDCTELMDAFSLDLASELTYGEDAGIQDGTGDKTYIPAISKYLSWLGYRGALRNLTEILSYIREPAVLTKYCAKSEALLISRQKHHPTSHDITSHLLQEDEESRRKLAVPRQLAANTSLSMLMGSAVGTTLTQTLRTLAKQKNIQSKLSAELDAHIKSGGEITTESIKNLPYLSAIISEALRLHNPFPTGAHAIIGPNGLKVGSHTLPPHAQVYVPILTLMTSEKYFEKADQFIPERWTEKEEMVKDKRAYIPFGYGEHACAGRQLAVNELRLVLARLVVGFEIEVVDDEKWEEGWRDYSMVRLGEFKVRFKSRK